MENSFIQSISRQYGGEWECVREECSTTYTLTHYFILYGNKEYIRERNVKREDLINRVGWILKHRQEKVANIEFLTGSVYRGDFNGK